MIRSQYTTHDAWSQQSQDARHEFSIWTRLEERRDAERRASFGHPDECVARSWEARNESIRAEREQYLLELEAYEQRKAEAEAEAELGDDYDAEPVGAILERMCRFADLRKEVM